MSEKVKKPLYAWSVLTNRCPRCREGKLFKTDKAYDLKNNLKMHENCPVCGQPAEIEVGFYYGTGYVSYGLTVGLSLFTFFAWYIILGFSIQDNSIFYWLGLNSVLLILIQPILMRISRTLWLSMFVKYDANWKENKTEDYERLVKEHMNNW